MKKVTTVREVCITVIVRLTVFTQVNHHLTQMLRILYHEFTESFKKCDFMFRAKEMSLVLIILLLGPGSFVCQCQAMFAGDGLACGYDTDLDG